MSSYGLMNAWMCNIPLVGIGILPVKRVRGHMFMKFITVRNVYDAVLVKHELIIRVSANTFKTKGIMVLSRKRYISTIDHKYFILELLFLSLGFEKGNSLLLLSNPTPSLSSHDLPNFLLLVIKLVFWFLHDY